MRFEQSIEHSRTNRPRGKTAALLCACALLALAGCDRLAKAPPEEADAGADATLSADPAAGEVLRVAASDTIGEGLGEITGLAFWTHPTLSFESLVIASTGDGIIGLVIENGAEAARASGFAATGVAVSYLGEGPAAQGYAVAAVKGDPAYKFYAIDNVTREFFLKPTMFIAEKTEGGFCFGRAANGEDMALHQTTPSGLTSYALSFSSGGVAAREVERRPSERALVDCAVDDGSGDVYALDAEGGVIRFGDGAAGERLPMGRGASRRVYGRGALGMIGSRAGAGDIGAGDIEDGIASGGKPGRRVSLVRLNAGNGVLDVIDGETGAALGAIRFGETFDDKGVARSATVGVGSGNFGGVYRDGVLALVVVEDDGGSTIRLAPWGGVTAALGQPAGDAFDPRAPRPAPAPPEIRIELPQP